MKRTVQMDAVERQTLSNQVSAEYGSLAFMYAKQVYQGAKSLDTINARFHEAIQQIIDYVEENDYSLILM